MVKIRLRRTGARKKPTYRVVVTDQRSPRDGRFIEIVGHYNPKTEPSAVKIHEDRVLHWLSVGAQPTDPVKRLLKNLGTLDRFSRLKEGADLEELLAEAEAASERNEAVTQNDTNVVTDDIEDEVLSDVETEDASEETMETEDVAEETAVDSEESPPEEDA